MKFISQPNEQFVIRRRAYAMIKQAFDADGIEFPSLRYRSRAAKHPPQLLLLQRIKCSQNQPRRFNRGSAWSDAISRPSLTRTGPAILICG
jgi:hypothetical protein